MGRLKGVWRSAEGGEAGCAGVVLLAADGEAEAQEEEELPLERVELVQFQPRDLRPAAGSDQSRVDRGQDHKLECSYHHLLA